MTAVKSPIGIEKSEIDGVLAMKEVYTILLPYMKKSMKEVEDIGKAGRIGVGWGSSGGEAGALLTDNYLAADGIENVIRVLDDLEDQKLEQLEFIELNACAGGCVGGVLTVENPYAAKVKLKRLRKYLPVACTHLNPVESDDAYWTKNVLYEPVFKIGQNMKDSIQKMAKVEQLNMKFPGLDCGSCGAPTCKALAEDIVRGRQSRRIVYIYSEIIFIKYQMSYQD